MFAAFIAPNEMYYVNLPDKIEGRFNLGASQSFGGSIAVEAVEGHWRISSCEQYRIFKATPNGKIETVLPYVNLGVFEGEQHDYINITGFSGTEFALIYSEPGTLDRQTLSKFTVSEGAVLGIGNHEAGNALCYRNQFIAPSHASLSYAQSMWRITAYNHINRIYVNGTAIPCKQETLLRYGDFIYIMGLKIIVGSGFIAFNNPGGTVAYDETLLKPYRTPELVRKPAAPIQTVYYRGRPVFDKRIEPSVIEVNPPPPLQKQNLVPLALMLGSSVTMGLTSLGVGTLNAWNSFVANSGVIYEIQAARGGSLLEAYLHSPVFMQSLPMFVTSAAMLAGAVLWPVLTRAHEKRKCRRGETKRKTGYMTYLQRLDTEITEELSNQAFILTERFQPVGSIAESIGSTNRDLWKRSRLGDYFMQLRLGLGDVKPMLRLDCKSLQPEDEQDELQQLLEDFRRKARIMPSVPVCLSLKDEPLTGVIGPAGSVRRLLQMITLQAALLHRYDELKLAVITGADDVIHWRWARWLPHIWNADVTSRMFVTNAEDAKALSQEFERRGSQAFRLFIINDITLAAKCHALEQMLYQNAGLENCSVIIGCDAGETLPPGVNTIINLTEDMQTSDIIRRGRNDREVVSVDPFDPQCLLPLSVKMANTLIKTNENHFSMPAMIRFLELYGVGKVEHLNSLSRWRESNPMAALMVPVGVNKHGDPFNIDLHEKAHGPHALLAGTTGSGKSEFLLTLILSLAVNFSPEELSFLLIDYKGDMAGAFTYDTFKLPHLAGILTNRSGSSEGKTAKAEMQRVKMAIDSELIYRAELFEKAKNISGEGTMDIHKYQHLKREGKAVAPLPHLMIIVDEFAQLVKDNNDNNFVDALVSSARVGRSLGVHLLLATQNPDGVVSPQINSNSRLKVSLKVQSKADSIAVLGRPDAAEIKQQGRFYMSIGFNESFELGQSAFCGANYYPREGFESDGGNFVRMLDCLGRPVLEKKPEMPVKSEKKEVVAVVEYLARIAEETNLSARSLWFDPLPEKIPLDPLLPLQDGSVPLSAPVGLLDDPANRFPHLKQRPLILNASESILIVGMPGSGKDMLLTALLYGLLSAHTPAELNIYIIDFNTEALKSFQDAPHVGGIAVNGADEAVLQLFKLLDKELRRRRSSHTKQPHILVVINNYAAFTERFSALDDAFYRLSRDGAAFGISFAVTDAAITMRYRNQQNFRTLLTTQMSNTADYQTLLGRTGGVLPAEYKGRGLVKADKVYEYQAAEVTEEALHALIQSLTNSFAGQRAAPIPVMPELVSAALFRREAAVLSRVPVGISQTTLTTAYFDFGKHYVTPVLSSDFDTLSSFARELLIPLGQTGAEIHVFDPKGFLKDADGLHGREWITGGLDKAVESWIGVLKARADMVDRQENMDAVPERVTLIMGCAGLYRILTPDLEPDIENHIAGEIRGKGFLTLCLKASKKTALKEHILVFDTLNELQTAPWQSVLRGGDGIWLGKYETQSFLSRKDDGTPLTNTERLSGYVFAKGRAKPVRFIHAMIAGEEEDLDEYGDY